jgi:hypothetical protein
MVNELGSNWRKDENSDLLCRFAQHFEHITSLGCSVYVGIVMLRTWNLHAAEPLVREPSPSENGIAIVNLKRYKSPGATDSNKR